MKHQVSDNKLCSDYYFTRADILAQIDELLEHINIFLDRKTDLDNEKLTSEIRGQLDVLLEIYVIPPILYCHLLDMIYGWGEHRDEAA